MHRADPEVQFAALQLCKQIGADRLAHFDLHLGKSRSVAMQEGGKNPVDHLRGSPDLQHTGIGAPEYLGLLA